MEANSSPLLTSRHAHHSAVWCVTGYSFPKLCIACATQRLENYSKGELSNLVKKILGEFQALLGPNAHACTAGESSLLSVLSSDQRVLEHLCGLLFGLLLAPDGSIAQASLDVLMTLLELTKLQTITRKLLQKAIQSVMTCPNLPSSLPHLNLIGQLLHSQPPLCTDIAHSYSNFLEFLLSGMSYPDEKIKSSVVYVLVQVCSKTQPNALSVPLVQNMCRHISTNLATAKSHELTINLLGLVRHLLKSGRYTQCLIQADRLNSEAKGSTFASAFKRTDVLTPLMMDFSINIVPLPSMVLLSHDELLQVSGVQCIAEVLSHHIDYGKVLLRADIAEFLFEALSSKSELLMNSLFFCLNSLASIDEFYSKYHVVYGIDPVLTGLATVLRLRNYTAAQIGLSLLTKILTRQPNGMPLFKSHQSVQVLLDLLSTALPVETVTAQATFVLTALMSAQHIPHGFPMSSLLPLMAHLLLLIEPLSTSTTVSTQQSETVLSPSMTGLLCEVLLCMERASKLAVGTDDQGAGVYLVNEDKQFLVSVFKESLLPITLLHMDHLDSPSPFASLLSMAVSLLDVVSTEQRLELAKNLCQSGFIELVLELKAKFPNTATGFSDLCDRGNHFLERLCVILEEGSTNSTDRVPYVRDVLHQALPHINCSPLDCLQLLSQRTGGQPLSERVTQGPTSLHSMQAAVLTLFYYAYTHDDVLVSECDLLKALNVFLSLNPNVHMLPSTTLSHITVLYALASANDTSSNAVTGHGLNRAHTGQSILTRGLQRVSNLDSLFVPNVSLLRWSIQQMGRTSSIVRAWLLQWLTLARCVQSSHMTGLIELLQTCPPVLESVMDYLCEPSDDCVDVDTLLEVVQQLLTNSESDSALPLSVYNSLHKIILKQRVQSLPYPTLAVLLTLLVRVQQYGVCADAMNSDLKLIYHIANVIGREDAVCASNSAALCTVTQCGIEVLTKSLRHQTTSSQIVLMLLNNTTLLEQLASLLPQTNTAKAHSMLSAAVMEFIALLVELHHKTSTNISMKVDGPVLNTSALTSSLLSPLAVVQIAGLNVWMVVFSRGGETSPFVLRGELDKYKQIRLLTFLVQNSLVKGNPAVCRATVPCFIELMNYSSDSTVCHREGWSVVFLQYITDMYSVSVIPSHYISCVHRVLQSLLSTNEFKTQPVRKLPLHALSQLVYKSFLSYTQSMPSTDKTNLSQDFLDCFREIGKIDKTCLDELQWKNIDTNNTRT